MPGNDRPALSLALGIATSSSRTERMPPGGTVFQLARDHPMPFFGRYLLFWLGGVPLKSTTEKGYPYPLLQIPSIFVGIICRPST